MGNLLRKLALEGYKSGKKIQEINPSDYLVQDTAAFLLDLAKEIIKPW